MKPRENDFYDRLMDSECPSLRNVGSLDGREMIKMNNLAVGYFPSDSPEIGVYPPPQPERVEPLPEPGETNS